MLLKFVFAYLLISTYTYNVFGEIVNKIDNTTESAEVPCDDPNYYTFRCHDGTCIERLSFCDGKIDCRDGSDEEKNTSRFDGMMCQYRRRPSLDLWCILPDENKCDHEIDCIGGQDECGCEGTFKCDNGDCVLKVSFCDNLDEFWGCLDGSDEREYSRTEKKGFRCPVTKTYMTKSCILPDRYVCDGDSDCDLGIDECFCNFTAGQKKGVPIEDAFSNENCFRCLDRSLVIPNIYVCDGIVHCDDLSDECACPEKKGYRRPEICRSLCTGPECNCPGQIQCMPRLPNNVSEISAKNATECFDRISVCDRLMDCENKVDEMFCPIGENAFHCNDGSKIIARHEFCNGPVDCPDASDETQCHDFSDFFCDEYRPFFKNVTDWNDKNETRSKVAIPKGRVVRFDRPFFTKKCDGVAMCGLLTDECDADCDEEPEYCKFASKGFKCPNSRSRLIGVEVCDGKPACNDTHPAESADEFGCPGRFYCHNKGRTRLPIHIPFDGKCNGKKECDDFSDEMNCSRKTHFYCNDGGSTLFVLVNQVCDGRSDCKEGGDECQNCNPSPFSSDERLINSRVLIWFLWIIGLFALIGNTATSTSQTIDLYRRSSTMSTVSVTNKILVLNLSLSDLLVGVYLIGLGIIDATSHSYCVMDQEWRSSLSCSLLGSVALIGTETSVFILTIMTAYRLHIVHSPFKNLDVRIILCLTVIAWVTSITLAFVPLAISAQDYFVSCVWFRTHPFIGKICRGDLQDFIKNLEMLESGAEMLVNGTEKEYNWANMISAMKRLNSSYEPERYFGYYSAHSVCLPKLFSDPTTDEAWGYTLLLIMINFLAFVFILASYIVIYRTTTRRNIRKSKSDETASMMQRKISRIILTDFCCWFPICMMSFLSVGGVPIPDSAYAITAIILLPINSAMNPLLYSDVLDVLWKKLSPASSIMEKLDNQVEMVKEKFHSHKPMSVAVIHPSDSVDSKVSPSTKRSSISSPQETRLSTSSNDVVLSSNNMKTVSETIKELEH